MAYTICKSFNINNLRRFGTFRRCFAPNAFYVLLPEIPPDTPETNPLLRLEELPKFSGITPDKIVTGCAKLAITYDVETTKHIDSLKDFTVSKDFSSVFEPLEKYTVGLNYAWCTAKNLSYTKGGDFRTAFQRIHPQVERTKNERWLSVPLYNAVKEVAAGAAILNEFQLRLVQMYLLEARLNGIEIQGSDRKKFMTTLSNLIEAKNHFRNRVMISHNLFSHAIEDFGLIATMPKDLVTTMAMDKFNPSRGPWRVTLNQNLYLPFLEHCPDRTERWNVWKAFNNRASRDHDEKNLSNHMIIKDIRAHRQDIAAMLGYENFAEMSMETKMAGSVDNVLSMIESLKSKYKPLAVEEITKLTEFARSEGFTDTLQPWDLAYWSRRQKDHLYRVDHDFISQYFPFNKVLNGIFELCDELFGITIVDFSKDVETWHQDVKFFKVFDSRSEEHLASFYLDAYSRPNKLPGCWSEAGRERSSLLGTIPISYMNFNLQASASGSPVLLTFDEVLSIIYEFGHGLQQMLTVVPYSEIAGQRNLAWDTLQVVPLVLQHLLTHPSTFPLLTGHHQTGEPLAINQLQLLLARRQHMHAFQMMKQLYYSTYDLEVHVSDEHWVQVMSKVWKEFVPLPLHPSDNHPCSLAAVFCDQYAASFYSFKWAEMVAADIFQTFKDAGIDSTDSVKPVSLRFRDTFLALGGGIPASEVFRRFQGRDPSVDALLHFYEQ